MNGQAADAVKGPAYGLMATAGIGALAQVVSLALNVLGVGMGAMGGGGDERVVNMFSGGIGIVFNVIGMLVAGFIIYGAMQMMKLEKYGLAMGATIAAMVPCISPCCILGLPLGIWSLVVLMKPEVKAAFVG